MNNQGLGHEGCRYLAEALEKGRCLSKNQGLLLKIFSGGRNRLENVGAQMLSKVFCDMGSLEEVFHRKLKLPSFIAFSVSKWNWNSWGRRYFVIGENNQI